MHRSLAALLSGVTLVSTLGLAGCGEAGPSAPPPSDRALTDASIPFAPTVAPLPPVDQLTGVLYKLADPSIPAAQKIGLIQYATPDDEPALTNFAQALKDGGYTPVTVDATGLAWAGGPGHLVASVTIGSTNPGVRPFTVPMEFAPIRDTWQLSRRTADQLLPLGGAASPTR